MGVQFLGLRPNILGKSFCTFSTDGFFAEPPEATANWLKTEEPSDPAVITSINPLHSRWFFDLSNLEFTFRGFALVNHNFTPGSYVKWTNYQPAIVTVAPGAIPDSNNIIGTIGDVDESLDGPDANVIQPDNNFLPWDVTFTMGFGFPANPPKLGTAEGQIILIMRTQPFGSGIDDRLGYPIVKVDLYDDTTFISHLGYRAVTATEDEPQMFVFPFDFADISDPALLSFKVTGLYGPAGHSI